MPFVPTLISRTHLAGFTPHLRFHDSTYHTHYQPFTSHTHLTAFASDTYLLAFASRTHSFTFAFHTHVLPRLCTSVLSHSQLSALCLSHLLVCHRRQPLLKWVLALQLANSQVPSWSCLALLELDSRCPDSLQYVTRLFHTCMPFLRARPRCCIFWSGWWCQAK